MNITYRLFIDEMRKSIVYCERRTCSRSFIQQTSRRRRRLWRRMQRRRRGGGRKRWSRKSRRRRRKRMSKNRRMNRRWMETELGRQGRLRGEGGGGRRGS